MHCDSIGSAGAGSGASMRDEIIRAITQVADCSTISNHRVWVEGFVEDFADEILRVFGKA